MIDTHVHIGRFLNDTWDERHLEALWDHGVEQAWCSSLSAGTVGMRFGNDELRRVLEREPRLRGLAWVVPYDPDWRRIAADCLAAGFIGIKIHPPMDRWQPSEDLLGPILELAGSYGVPVLMHEDSLNLVGEFIGRYAAVPLVVYHLGAFDGLWLAEHHPNVWLELSWCDTTRKIRAAVRTVGAERLLYGTDAPIRLVRNAVIDRQDGAYRSYPELLLSAIEQAVADAAERDAILRGNARRLLDAARIPLTPPREGR